jgi:hypothetical protein
MTAASARTPQLCRRPGCAKAATVLWAIDDGYGHNTGQTLRCDDCPRPSMWHDHSRRYRPKHDDCELGLSRDPPPQWASLHCPPGELLVCWDCERPVDTSRRVGYGWCVDAKGRQHNIYFCKPCYRQRDCQPPSVSGDDAKFPHISRQRLLPVQAQ